MHCRIFLCLLILIAGCQPIPREAGVHGIVKNVADGDTFTMITSDKKEIRVRLYGVDAPERGQDFSRVSRNQLSDLVMNKTVEVFRQDTDQYDRLIGIVHVDGIVVNESMLRSGLVWHYKQFDTNPVWASLEASARAEGKGLWAKDNPQPPWEFRRMNRKQKLN